MDCKRWLLLWLGATVSFVADGRRLENDTSALDAKVFLPQNDYSDLAFVYFTSDCLSKISVPISDSGKLLTIIDRSKPNIIHFHGFTESATGISVNTLADAFCERGTHNFILGDWSKYAKQPYLSAYQNVKGVGKAFGQALVTLVGSGLDSKNLCLIGHSLGAHVAGILAKTTADAFRLPRIIGLDPAGPLFWLESYLTGDCADKVHVIHTDAGYLGYHGDDGTIDFWPNGGSRVQPACSCDETSAEDALIGCNHAMSWRYMAESVRNETVFQAVLCQSYDDFRNKRCTVNGSNTVFMGFADTPSDIVGNAYLITAADSPYGLSEAGTHPAA